jgi:hypothetical protein
MKNILPVIIIVVLLASGLGAAVSSTPIKDRTNPISLSLQFSQPIFSEKENGVLVTMQNTNAWFNEPGYPLLPAYRKTFTLPFGTKVTDVSVTFSDLHTQVLTQPILPGTEPVPLNSQSDEIAGQIMNTEVYASTQTLPQEQFNYVVNAGLNGLEHVFYLTVLCYPVHYTPASNILIWNEQLNIEVQTKKPTKPFTFSDQYDLLIIAPAKFTDAIQPLITHKNAKGVSTVFKTVEDLISQYSGRDAPEKIKYGIKDIMETTGIHYVLLIGGINSFISATPRDDANQGTKDWNVPVRYTNLYDGGGTQDPGCLSDLYYADLYNGTGAFSSWDSDGDNVFAEWKQAGKDIIDLYPDVYVGRLACVNAKEVKTMVDKIITYESTPADPAWFKTMVVIGSDTFNDTGTNYREGEVENQKALDYMTGFEAVKIWGSHRNTSGLVPVPKDIVKTISQGCGFLAFAGHGSPERWNTYWPGSFEEKRARGLWFYNIPFINNKEKLPVCVIGGCHNSQFNVTATGFLTGTPWVYSPVPECFSWLFCRNTHGGAIATMGNTGLGYGAVGNNGDQDGDGVDDPDCIEVLGGYLEIQFFKAYGVNHTDILGQTWGQAITSYLKTYPGMMDKIDCKTVQEWALLGDPSLKIGGYES